MAKEEYTTAQDHENIIRANLLGQPFPEDVVGKMESPLFDVFAEDFLNRKVREELTAEGYSEGDDGVWAKD